MSLKYYSFFLFLCINGSHSIIIHPHVSNRIIDKEYEWSLSYNASTMLQEIVENLDPRCNTTVTPINYTKLSSYEKISFINTQHTDYCVILSFYESLPENTTIRLYYPYTGNSDTSNNVSSSLSFVPYQYGYRKNSAQTYDLIQSFYTHLLTSANVYEIFAPKRAPLKIGIGIECPSIFIEIGIYSSSHLQSVLTIIGNAINSVLLGKV